MKVPQYLYSTIEELQRYIALLIQPMQTCLSDNGWTVPQKTTIEITRVINGTIVPYFEPVMPAGTIWYDTTINKLRLLTIPAVPGTSNGMTEIVTSV